MSYQHQIRSSDTVKNGGTKCPPSLVSIRLSKDVCRPAGTLVVQKTLTGKERLFLFARKEILISGRPTAAKCWETFWRSLQISFSPHPQTLGNVKCSKTDVFVFPCLLLFLYLRFIHFLQTYLDHNTWLTRCKVVFHFEDGISPTLLNMTFHS